MPSLESCVDENGKEKRCSEVQLSLNDEHWQAPPLPSEDPSVMAERLGSRMRLCETVSDARAEAAKCKAKPEQVEPPEPMEPAPREL